MQCDDVLNNALSSLIGKQWQNMEYQYGDYTAVCILVSLKQYNVHNSLWPRKYKKLLPGIQKSKSALISFMSLAIAKMFANLELDRQLHQTAILRYELTA